MAKRDRERPERLMPHERSDSTHHPSIETEPKPDVKDIVQRVGIPVTDDKGGILWDRMKSDKGREKLRALIASEAAKMGYSKAVTRDEGAVTGRVLFGLVNTIVTGAGATLGFDATEISIASFSEDDQRQLNEDGRIDRLCAKWFGSTTFKYADEAFAGIILIALVNAKTQAIRAHRVTKRRPRAVVSEIPVTVDRTEGTDRLP